jgi:hypothetical protein
MYVRALSSPLVARWAIYFPLGGLVRVWPNANAHRRGAQELIDPAPQA